MLLAPLMIEAQGAETFSLVPDITGSWFNKLGRRREIQAVTFLCYYSSYFRILGTLKINAVFLRRDEVHKKPAVNCRA